MQDKVQFKESLAAIIELAQAQNNKITKKDIEKEFEENEMTSEQYEYIYAYLETSHVNVTDYIKNEQIMKKLASDEVVKNDKEKSIVNEENKNNNKKLTKEEKDYLEIYLEDLGAVKQLSESEEIEALKSVIENNKENKNLIIENNLRKVVEIVNEYVGKGMVIGDLIQEGNIGLLEGIEKIKNEEQIKKFNEIIEECVRKQIEDALDEQTGEERIEEHIVEKINRLDKVTKELMEELDRKVTVDEIAEAMEISNEEVNKLLKISKNASDVEKHHHN